MYKNIILFYNLIAKRIIRLFLILSEHLLLHFIKYSREQKRTKRIKTIKNIKNYSTSIKRNKNVKTIKQTNKCTNSNVFK